jgi:hypothetical protein
VKREVLVSTTETSNEVILEGVDGTSGSNAMVDIRGDLLAVNIDK